MKFPVLSIAALTLATARAELTPFNATYDLFVATQLCTLGSATDAVTSTHDPWLLDAFQPVVDTFETALTAATHDGAFYWDLLTKFFTSAATHDARYTELQRNVSSYDQPAMTWAPRQHSDATFAVFQSVLPTDKDKDKAPVVIGWTDTPLTWQQLYDSERKAMEKLIDSNDRDTVRITARMERLEHKLFLDAFLGSKFSKAWACLDKRMREAYHGGAGVDPRLSCSAVPKI